MWIDIRPAPMGVRSIDSELRHMKLVRTQNRQTTGAHRPGGVSDIMGSSGLADEARFVENQLPGALERGELSLYYQPQFQLPDVRMVGSEALLRWNHPER